MEDEDYLNWWKNQSADTKYCVRIKYLDNCIEELSIEQIKDYFEKFHYFLNTFEI